MRHSANEMLLLVAAVPWAVLRDCHLTVPDGQAYFDPANHLNWKHASNACYQKLALWPETLAG